jgi:hypothetical protein
MPSKRLKNAQPFVKIVCSQIFASDNILESHSLEASMASK